MLRNQQYVLECDLNIRNIRSYSGNCKIFEWRMNTFRLVFLGNPIVK